jgi:hypothetical protein
MHWLSAPHSWLLEHAPVTEAIALLLWLLPESLITKTITGWLIAKSLLPLRLIIESLSLSGKAALLHWLLLRLTAIQALIFGNDSITDG